MPSSLLFAINNEGRVHTLSTSGSMWKEIPYSGQDFKKISAIPHFLWALGGDHQIYVYVHGLDVPIRIREESYENERWLPLEGFCSHLLPTDRYRFSNADGTVDRSIEKIRLPSMAWQWEGDWKLELTLEGQPLDHNGWTYAIDFPAQYYPKKQWKSYVRRRLWVRSRRYAAMNSWCAIAPLHEDATREPFIDISIGGQNVPGAEAGIMLVWAVTALNRVMFRTGVSTKSPEGVRWNCIQVPISSEVYQISVGPTGLVWASLLDGRALVRIGVSRENLSGESWLEVRGPGDNLKINQLSVGINAVWVITTNHQIWFRAGVKGDGGSKSEEAAGGSNWVEMVGRMSVVSVSTNDQVFATGLDDRRIYFRSGVCPEDLTGKRWKALQAPLQVSRASSNASLSRDKFHRSFNALSRPSSMVEQTASHEWDDQSHSAPTAAISLPINETKFEIQPKNPKAWSPVHSVGSVVGTECHESVDESVWSDGSRESCLFAEDDDMGWADYQASWSWVDAGACTIDPNQLPNWFGVEGFGDIQSASFKEPWRVEVLKKLKARLVDKDKYETYEKAVDTTSWIYTGEARISLGEADFIECLLQLEWLQESGTLTILNPDGASTMNIFNLSDITCVQNCSEPGSPRLTLFRPRQNPRKVRLQFTRDTQMEEWQTHFVTVCNALNKNVEKPSNESIWAVTNMGDIFIWDPTKLEASQLREDECYLQKFDLSAKESPIIVALHVKFIPGTILTLTGCIGDDAERLGINLEAPTTYKLKAKTYNEFPNTCLHFNPRFSDKIVVRNSMIEGKWGKEETEGDFPFERGQEFVLEIRTTEDAFLIYVNNKFFTNYRHRLPPNSVSMLSIWGRMQPYKLTIRSPEVILDPLDMYWRQIGGHLKRIETCRLGVTWAIGYDQTCWVYTGGWGGGFLGPLYSYNVNPMTDSQDYRIYENQRWNPLTGYTSTGLPTDRHMWSDSTGKYKRTKDQVKLISVKWQWVSDWMVDFHVPGGVDGDGWQYAFDFPLTFHAKKHINDYVRRRRWYRRCAIATSGPWQELGHTKLIDVALEPIKDDDSDSLISLWALATGGQAMYRFGVTRLNPMGIGWEHVTSDQHLTSISCGPYNQVWATDKKGCAHYRLGITDNKLEGESWLCVERPGDGRLKQISCHNIGVWAVDHLGRLHVRKGNDNSPQGSAWQTINIDPTVLNSAPNTKGFIYVSVANKEVWAVTNAGVLARRIGICEKNPAGLGWSFSIQGNFTQVCVRAFN